MLMPMGTFEWQVLRAILRASPNYPNGRQLRLVPSRRTKDGSFLTDIVTRGLIKVVSKNKDPFEATYALTPLGEYAAEHGEYEAELSSLKKVEAAASRNGR
ncbi:MAG TPA: hypothetical protein VMZ71_11930 [Gemmataceae bacterium]|nr:hypothetical protein [Gemmataceae bacterium]